MVVNIRYMRHSYSQEFTDRVAKRMVDLLPPSTEEYELPAYWSHKSPEEFMKKYAHLGMVVWGRRNFYHVLLVNGHHVLRCWTKGQYSRVELNQAVLHGLNGRIVGLKVSPNTHYHGCVSVQAIEEADLIIKVVREVYGI